MNAPLRQQPRSETAAGATSVGAPFFERSFIDLSEVRPVVTCYCDTDPVYASYAVTGLIELASAGEIELRFRLRDHRLPKSRGFWALWLQVAAEGVESGVAIDCHDLAHYYCSVGMEACRLYFKSNLGPETYRHVPQHLHSKLRPLGPYLPSRPIRDRALWRRWIGNVRVKFDHRFFLSMKSRGLYDRWKKFAPELNRHKRYASRKVYRDYEAPPADDFVSAQTDAAAPIVFFNPSCWDEDADPTVARINETRSRLICGLRDALGSRFDGGFRRYGPVWRRYAAAAEDRTIPHDEYVRLVKTSLVSVYVNGLGNCFSWRLAEIMAASQCVVTEPIINDAGFPFDESTGFVERQTPEEMVAAVVELANNPERIRLLRRRMWQTYVNRVRPPTRIRQVLTEVIQAARNTAESRT